MMAGRHEGMGGYWPYPGSGPSGSSDTEAGLARLAARWDAKSDLPSGQGEEGAPEDNRASAADALRASLREVADPREPTAPAAPQTPEGIRAALRDGVGVHEAPAPQAAEGIRADPHREALWSAEGTLRNAPEVLVTAANELESIIKGGNVPVSVVPRLKAVVKSLRGINLHDLGVAQSYVGTEAYKMDMEANNRQ
ncbi:MAG: hypothetical protein D8B38_04885 [Candidatus Saccharimonas sp.]|nr:MAG: hypothetical protein D8B38_04885 [Candidatus Saccharimonas sp.]